MRKIILGIFIGLVMQLEAQYIPQGVNYGIAATGSFREETLLGFSPRVEYAPTCYTSYMATYGYLFPIADSTVDGIHEFSFSVNTILFNFEPTYITVGAGYMFNTSSTFDEKDNEAILFFKTGDINHGLELKLRALIRLKLPLHVFAEMNIRSLGREYDTIGVGILYDFDLD